MYVIFEDGGRQHLVREGDVVVLDRRDAEPGQTIELDKVLLCHQDDGTRLGAPYLEGAKVVARVEAQTKGPKIVVGKYRRRKRYRRKTGFRALGTRVRIQEIALS